jgi:hypothetical protein
MGEGAHALEALLKALPIAAGVVLLALGVIAGSVFGLGDDELFVSPPEIVAQEFVRALAYRHYGVARGMLTRQGERDTSTGELRRISDALRSRIGRLDDVTAVVVERSLDTAVLRVELKGERASAALRLPAVREFGAWSVSRVSDVAGGGEQPAGPEKPR